MNALDELAALELDIRRSLPHNKDPEAIVRHVAKWLHKDGYRKPKVVGYIVVDRDGDVIGRKFTVHEAAQAFADEWTADCKTAGIEWEYRVAEIVEPQP